MQNASFQQVSMTNDTFDAIFYFDDLITHLI